MYLEVYPDVIFVLNFIIDFILLFLLSKIARRNSNWRRRMGAAAIGALSAALVGVFPWMNLIIRFLLMNIAVSVVMLRITFGRMRKSEYIKLLITLYLITYFAGGLINSIYYYTDFHEKLTNFGNAVILGNISWEFVVIIILMLIPLTYLLLWLLRWYRSGRKETYEVELFFDTHTIHTTALLDTGNCLYDPIFKKPVMVMEAALLEKLLPDQAFVEFKAVTDLMTAKEENIIMTDGEYSLRFRLIPYHCVGKTEGIMPGLILDKVLIHTSRDAVCNEKVTVAVCDSSLSVNDDYHVLLHKDLI